MFWITNENFRNCKKQKISLDLLGFISCMLLEEFSYKYLLVIGINPSSVWHKDMAECKTWLNWSSKTTDKNGGNNWRTL
jgi:hypothetical protein